jgi:putative Mg2+ transporter-C (MgtC) family protein
MPSVLGLWGDSLDHLVHLLVAFVLALPIGWHRAREEQSAGLRTFPLVAIASCGLVQTAISVFGANATVNANIMQGVVTGIGFIGAGAIIRQGDSTTGHATAASIWTVGIMGAAVGCGQPRCPHAANAVMGRLITARLFRLRYSLAPPR